MNTNTAATKPTRQTLATKAGNKVAAAAQQTFRDVGMAVLIVGAAIVLPLTGACDHKHD